MYLPVFVEKGSNQVGDASDPDEQKDHHLSSVPDLMVMTALKIQYYTHYYYDIFLPVGRIASKQGSQKESDHVEGPDQRHLVLVLANQVELGDEGGLVLEGRVDDVVAAAAAHLARLEPNHVNPTEEGATAGGRKERRGGGISGGVAPDAGAVEGVGVKDRLLAVVRLLRGPEEGGRVRVVKPGGARSIALRE